MIDMQWDYLANVRHQKRKRMINAQLSVLEYCAEQMISVVVLEREGYQDTIDAFADVRARLQDVHLIKRSYMNGFTDTDLADHLKRRGVKSLLVMGVFAGRCIAETVCEAAKLDFHVLTARSLVAEGRNTKRYVLDFLKWFSDIGTVLTI